MNDYMNLRVKAKSVNEGFVRNCVALFCVRFNPTVEFLDDVKTAVSEAVTNCVVHAYPDGEGDIDITCRTDGDFLHIEITDSGKGILDIEQAITPYFTTDDEGERAGIGFTVMKSFCDYFEVKNNIDGGVSVILRKKIVCEV